MTPPDPIDCLVIGAGPAGLATAIYLARFRRRFEVIDDGNSRAAWIPVSHNLAGFASGISGKNLLSRMTSHAKKYGAAITQGSVVTLAGDTGGLFVATAADGRVIRASTVMFATGVIDDEPALPQLRQAVRRRLIRHCGICDCYEVIDKKVGVIGYPGAAS
jgi:thioredoxin reductase (NADPH)